MMKLSNLGLLSVLTLSVSAYATSTSNAAILVTPHCLLKNQTFSYQTLVKSGQFSLIKTDEKGLDQLILAKTHQKSVCGGFMNVTHAWQTEKAEGFSVKKKEAFLSHYINNPGSLDVHTYEVKYPNEVQQLFSLLNPQDMLKNLNLLIYFPDRYANSDDGALVPGWIKDQLGYLIRTSGRNDVTISMIPTSSYKQSSVVMKIGTSNEPGVVIGGHMDTLRARNGSVMPGADDDATGVVTLLETARTLLTMHFNKPIYLIWYAAEEVGLVGSQHVVAHFKKQNIPVEGVVQLDMTGYAPNNKLAMWLMKDYTDNNLTSFMETLIKTYIKRPVRYTACGYACSDHASWTLNGYKAVLPAEAAMEKTNPYIHSPQDRPELLSLAHMTDYAKLAIAAAVELAEPVK